VNESKSEEVKAPVNEQISEVHQGIEAVRLSELKGEGGSVQSKLKTRFKLALHGVFEAFSSRAGVVVFGEWVRRKTKMKSSEWKRGGVPW
jgi:hypothetical protein